MKKVVIYSLVFLMPISASATNWIELGNSNSGVNYYIDADSINIVNENTQLVTGFFRQKNLGKHYEHYDLDVEYASVKMAYDCKNESSQIVSAILYDSTGKALHTEDHPIKWSSFKQIHPDTSGYLQMYATCYLAGFKKASD